MCHCEILKNSNFCVKCFGLQKININKPNKEILEKEILQFPMTTIGKKYDVSDNTIRRWCKNYKILLPYNRGYWSKIKK
jgi:hypothetical protein